MARTGIFSGDSHFVLLVPLFLSKEGSAKVGTPYIAKAAVKGELLDEIKSPKVFAFKYKQRKGIRRKVGHRQRYSRVKITEIIG